MTYIPLGPRPVLAAADTTGHNLGNYTAVFDLAVIGINTPYCEMYHLYITAPTLTGQTTTARITLNLANWDITLLGQANAWDANQPMLLTPGDTFYVFFNVPTSNTTIPTVTAWFRHQSG